MKAFAKLRAQAKESALLASAVFALQNLKQWLKQGKAPQRSATPKPYRFVIYTRIKNEGRFLPEWVCYYLGLGVEHFFIYNNGSTDGIHERLKPLIDAGYVTLVDWPTVPAYPGSFYDFRDKHGHKAEWMAFLDADEFIVEKTEGDLRRLLDSDPSAAGYSLHWRYFGSSYHETIPAGLLIENFTRADLHLNRHVKSIVRMEAVCAPRNSHSFFYWGGRVPRDPLGRRVWGSFSTPDDSEPVVINHYVYRSREDYAAKCRKGFVDKRGAMEQARNEARIESEFPRHNEAEFKLRPEVLERTKEWMRRFGYPTA